MHIVEVPVTTAPRRPVPLLVRLGEAVIGRTRNLSRDGMFVETPSRPALGSVHALLVAWDDGVHSCAARVVRHADDGIGLTFDAPDADFTRMVADIMVETAREPPTLTLAPQGPVPDAGGRGDPG